MGPKSPDELVASWKRICARNQHVVAVCWGSVGAGKSTMALALGKKIDPEFTPRRNVFKYVEEAIKAAPSLPEGSVVIYDEAVRGADRRGANTKQNRGVAEWFDTCRELNLIHILAIPEVTALDRRVMNHVQWGFHCRRNGHKHEYSVKNPRKGKYGPYFTDQFDAGSRWQQRIPHFQKHYPDIWQEYLDVKNEAFYGKPEEVLFRERLEHWRGVLRDVLEVPNQD